MKAEGIARQSAPFEEPENDMDAVEGKSSISRTIEATLPLRVSQKWVAHACRMAGIGKPRWNRHTSTWTATGVREDGANETIVLRQGSSPTSVVITVSWQASDGEGAEPATARRLVTALFTGMQWSLRQRMTGRAPVPSG
ncbi:MAG TPA: hypothetical protein VM580_33480 [Labilithrix sp.]|nr:hypothetical protein [Labilithrix sp.]